MFLLERLQPKKRHFLPHFRRFVCLAQNGTNSLFGSVQRCLFLLVFRLVPSNGSYLMLSLALRQGTETDEVLLVLQFLQEVGYGVFLARGLKLLGIQQNS